MRLQRSRLHDVATCAAPRSAGAGGRLRPVRAGAVMDAQAAKEYEESVRDVIGMHAFILDRGRAGYEEFDAWLDAHDAEIARAAIVMFVQEQVNGREVRAGVVTEVPEPSAERTLTPCGNLVCTGCGVCGCPALGIAPASRKPQGEPSDARVQEERIADLRQARNAVSGALAHQLHHRDPDMFFLAVRQMLESARYLVDGYAPGAEDDNREVIDYKALAARLKLEHDEQCEGTYAWGARSGYCRCAERAQGGE